MSWSKSYTGRKAFDKDEGSGGGLESDEAKAQLVVARKAAKLVLNTGKVGKGRGKDFSVSLSGHANPGHEPKEGWANDTISVVVTQIIVQKKAATPPVAAAPASPPPEVPQTST